VGVKNVSYIRSTDAGRAIDAADAPIITGMIGERRRRRLVLHTSCQSRGRRNYCWPADRETATTFQPPTYTHCQGHGGSIQSPNPQDSGFFECKYKLCWVSLSNYRRAKLHPKPLVFITVVLLCQRQRKYTSRQFFSGRFISSVISVIPNKSIVLIYYNATFVGKLQLHITLKRRKYVWA